MASFTTATISIPFTADRDDYTESRQARVAVQEIPGGDTFYADRAGRGPMNVKFSLLLANATDYGALFGQVERPGTLVIEGLDSHAVILMSVSAPVPFLGGQRKASAEFLITDV